MLPQHIPSAVTLSEEGVERLKVSFPSTVLLLPYSQMSARKCDFSSCTSHGTQGSSLYPTALQLHHQIRADFAELSVRRLIHLPEEAEPATLLSMP